MQRLNQNWNVTCIFSSSSYKANLQQYKGGALHYKNDLQRFLVAKYSVQDMISLHSVQFTHTQSSADGAYLLVSFISTQREKYSVALRLLCQSVCPTKSRDLISCKLSCFSIKAL